MRCSALRGAVRLGTAGRRRSCCTRVSAVSPTQVDISVRPGDSFSVGTLWLRDSDPAIINGVTNQRDQDLISSTAIRSAAVKDGMLKVTWDEGTSSAYSVQWLQQQVSLNSRVKEASAQPLAADGMVPDDVELWDKSSWKGGLPESSYVNVMESDEHCLTFLRQIRRHGFSTLQGCPTGDEFDAEPLAKRVANYVRCSIYGGVWDFGPSEADASDYQRHNEGVSNADTAYASCGLPFHTDGTYNYDPPGLQMFQCVKRGCVGGDNGLVDGFSCLRRLRVEHPEHFEVLQRFVVPYHYRDEETGIDLRNETPVIVSDFRGQLLQLRFNNTDRAILPVGTPAAVFDAWSKLSEIIHEERSSIVFPLMPGTTLIFDNWRLLHNRTGFSGVRKMSGCYMNMEDFRSKLRSLEAVVGGSA